jgi:hypothetical protein
MSLIEFLVANLGSAVAKSILKFWARDSGFAQNAGEEIIDFLKSKVSEGMASRRGSRQFEAIAEDVAESLLPVFAHENLGEEDKKRVAETVGNVIRDLRISAGLLVKKNLDPTELSKLISQAGVDQKRLFSADEGAFFDRLADECAQYILDISSQLPILLENRERLEELKMTVRLGRDLQALQNFLLFHVFFAYFSINWRGFAYSCGFPRRFLMPNLGKLKRLRVPVVVVRETGRELYRTKERLPYLMLEFPLSK